MPRFPSLLSTFLCLWMSCSLLYCQSNEKWVDFRIEEAYQLKNNGLFADALSSLSETDSLIAVRSITSTADQKGEIHYIRGLLLYNLDDTEASVAEFRKSIDYYTPMKANGKLADSYLGLSNSIWYVPGTPLEVIIDNYDKAIEYAELDKNNTRRHRGKYYADKGYALVFTDYLADSKQLIEQGINLDTTHLGWYHPATAETFMTYSVYHRINEDNYTALDWILKVEEIYEQILPAEKEIDKANLYGNIALIYFQLQQYHKAIDYYLKALSVFTAKLAPDHQRIILVYLGLGEVYHNLGQHNISHQYYQKARQLIKDERSPSLINCTIGDAFYHASRKEYSEAYALTSSVIPDVVATYGYSKNLAQVYETTAEYATQIDSFERARQLLHTVIPMKQYLMGENHSSLAKTYALLAQNFLLIDQLDSARFYNEAGLNLLWESHQDFAQVTSVDIFPYLLETRAELALKSQQADAKQKALEDYLLMDAYFDYLRTSFSEPDDRQALAEFIHNAHAEIIRLAVELGHTEPEYWQQAFLFSEKNKAYALLKGVRENSSVELKGYIRDIKALRAAVQFYERRLAAETTQDPTTAAEWRAIIFKNKRAIEELTLEMKALHGTEMVALETFNYATVEKARALLQTGQAILEYFVGQKNIYAFVIGQDQLEVVAIAIDDTFEDQVNEFRALTSQPFSSLAKPYTQLGHEIFQTLIKPVEAHLPERLILIPDYYLGYLPFDALLTDIPAKPIAFESHPYLLLKYQLSINYSITLFQEMQKRETHSNQERGTILAMAPFIADKTIDLKDNDLLLGNTRLRSADTLVLLPYSALEVETLRRQYTATLARGSAATKTYFLENAPKFRILHLATHAHSDAEAIDQTYLVFSDTTTAGIALLYLSDLYAMSLQAELVVLSACETGFGKIERGEGVISLARAFAFAGANSIVTTLWDINDASSQQMMDIYYSYLAKALPKDQALHTAKEDFIKNNFELNAHPAYWSAFLHIGNTNAINFLKKTK